LLYESTLTECASVTGYASE